jgi:tetratricopeptide (TPR) repeat protein
MRTIILLFAFLTLMVPSKADVATSVATAQEAYSKGEYAQALALYDSLDKTMGSAALSFNIGNCHMKLGDIPNAILHYERAIRSQPGADDIQSNLDYARSKVVDRVNELPALTLGSLWERLRGGKDVDQWARRSLWACLLTFAFAAGFVFVQHRLGRRILLGSAVLGVLFTCLSAGLAAYRAAEITDRSQAIIMEAKVDVHGEPREGSTTVFVLHEGTKVSVLQEQNGWFEVKLSSGSVGWAAPGSLVII